MQAIVLARRDFRERDQLVTVYTREVGKQEVLAKGLKKSTSKNASALLPFFLLEVEIVPGRDLSHITKVQILESFSEITASLLKIKLLKISLDRINRVIRGQESDKKIFDGLKNWLKYLRDAEEPRPEILDVFYIKMWAHLGLKIELDRCVSCGKKEAFGIDIKSGGVLCQACYDKKEIHDRTVRHISKDDIQFLKLLFVKNIEEAGKLLQKKEIGGLHELIYNFIQFHSHEPITDWKKLL